MTQSTRRPEEFAIEQLVGDISQSDMHVLAGIYKLSHPERGNVPLPELQQRLTGQVDESSHEALLVVRDTRLDSVVGAAMLRLQDEKGRTAHLEELFIHSRVRGIGLGRSLLKETVAFAGSEAASSIMLDRPVQRYGNDIPAYKLFITEKFKPNSQGLLERTL